MKRYSKKSFHPKASDLNHEAYGLGVDKYKAGKFRQAAQSFKDALDYWPLDPQAWYALGNCYDETDKPSKAEECFRKALRYTSLEKQAVVYFNLGNSLHDQNRFSEAIECYEKISAQDKVYDSAQKNIALAQNELSHKNT